MQYKAASYKYLTSWEALLWGTMNHFWDVNFPLLTVIVVVCTSSNIRVEQVASQENITFLKVLIPPYVCLCLYLNISFQTGSKYIREKYFGSCLSLMDMFSMCSVTFSSLKQSIIKWYIFLGLMCYLFHQSRNLLPDSAVFLDPASSFLHVFSIYWVGEGRKEYAIFALRLKKMFKSPILI